MDNNLLVAIAGILLSLGFGYIPGLRAWYEPLTSQQKSLVMLGLLALSAIGAFVASCYTPWQAVACGEAGMWELVELFVTAMIANQATYLVGVKPAKA